MATELKSCERCGSDNVGFDYDTARCGKCGHAEWLEDWNCRAMPECVRMLVDLALLSTKELDEAAADVVSWQMVTSCDGK